jgi:hypothetical protein
MKKIYPNIKRARLPQIHLRKKYYYVVAVVRDRPFVDGAFTSREEAQKLGWKSLQGVVWKIVESDIGDRARFTQTLHHDVLEDTGDIETAIKPIKHQI